jgi:hypothetical protein
MVKIIWQKRVSHILDEYVVYARALKQRGKDNEEDTHK